MSQKSQPQPRSRDLDQSQNQSQNLDPEPTPTPTTAETILSPLATALSNAVPNSFHYWHPAGTVAPYLVWKEDGDSNLWAGNGAAELAITGTVDYFTNIEYDPALDLITAALESVGASWYLNSVQFEDQTNLIHHEWVFEVV